MSLVPEQCENRSHDRMIGINATQPATTKLLSKVDLTYLRAIITIPDS